MSYMYKTLFPFSMHTKSSSDGSSSHIMSTVAPSVLLGIETNSTMKKIKSQRVLLPELLA